MSCIPSITPKLTRRQLREIKKQKLAYSSPAMRPSLMYRLGLLARDKDPKIRERAALDYHLPYALQIHLLNDKDVGVRTCLARNTGNLEWVTYDALSEDDDEAVRGFLVLNPKCPVEFRQVLAAEDPSDLVRRLAAFSLIEEVAVP